MSFRGELFYVTDADRLTVHSLVLRQREVAFDMTTSWANEGRWRVSGTATLEFDGRCYVCDTRCQCVETGEFRRCRIRFDRVEPDDDYLVVAGAWIEGLEYPFDGDLVVVEAP